MEINISDDQKYLNDVEFWCKIQKTTDLKNATPGFIYEMCSLIDSIEIYADSQKLCYISDARYLLSIIQQRKAKEDAEAGLFHTTDDYDFYSDDLVGVAAGGIGKNVRLPLQPEGHG